MNLNKPEIERLAILSEECGEVIQIIGKIMRHGYDSRHPNDINGLNNRNMLEKELGDLMFCFQFLHNYADVSFENICNYADQKAVNITEYLHYNEVYLPGERTRQERQSFKAEHD